MFTPKTIIEVIGTAILVFTIQVSTSCLSDLAPIAIGGILVSIVFAGGPVSGAHYNPAVSLAVAMRGSMPYEEMTAYMISQILGGALGGLCGGVVSGSFSVVDKGGDAHLLQALLAEVIFTFILCFVILSVATNPKVENNHYYGLSIGLVVASGAISVGDISGGVFNPAVGLGLSISSGFSNLIYVIMVVVANLIGGAVAALCFCAVLPDTASNGESGTVGESTPLRA